MKSLVLAATALLFAAALTPASAWRGALAPNTASLAGTAATSPALVLGIELPAR